jgi:hypothetical protein
LPCRRLTQQSRSCAPKLSAKPYAPSDCRE